MWVKVKEIPIILLILMTILGAFIVSLPTAELRTSLNYNIPPDYSTPPYYETLFPRREPVDIVLILLSYARDYTLREAYELAELVVLGRIISSEPIQRSYSHHWVRVVEVFKGRPMFDTIVVAQMGGWDLRGRLWLVPEDPPMEKGELVILFLTKGKGYNIKYPEEEYIYPVAFGRFRVVHGKVYSAMYFVPEEIHRIPCRRRAELLLKGRGYEKVNGITIEEFLKLLKCKFPG